MSKRSRKRLFVAVNDLAPVVESVSCYKFETNQWYRYHLPINHLILVLSGRIDAKTVDGPVTGLAGDLLCFRPTEWNEYGTVGPTVYFQAGIRFASPPRHQASPSLGEFGPMPLHVKLGHAFEEMRRVFETFCIEVPKPGTLHQLRLRAAVHELLAIVSSVLTGNQDRFQHLDEWDRLRLQMDTALTTDLSATDMARRMRLSRFYFNRAFKQRFGVAPRTYHTHARLQEATRLLQSTDSPVKEISAELGFRDAKVLARLFKRHFRLTPSEIRRGTASLEEPAPPTRGRLFPMNQQIVPPRQSVEAWVKRCRVQNRRR